MIVSCCNFCGADHLRRLLLIADVFEEFYSPVITAQGLLFAAAKKRKEILPKTMGFVMQVLTSPALQPREKAGALQMVSTVAEVLQTVRCFDVILTLRLGSLLCLCTVL